MVHDHHHKLSINACQHYTEFFRSRRHTTPPPWHTTRSFPLIRFVSVLIQNHFFLHPSIRLAFKHIQFDNHLSAGKKWSSEEGPHIKFVPFGPSLLKIISFCLFLFTNVDLRRLHLALPNLVAPQHFRIVRLMSCSVVRIDSSEIVSFCLSLRQ